MPTNIQTYGSAGAQLTNENATYYQKAMLDRLLPELHFAKYCEKKNIPKNAGATTQFRRLESLAAATSALTENAIPDGVDLTINAVTATVAEYGSYTKFTDFINMAGLDPLLTEVSELMGENAGLSIDTIVRDVMVAGTTVFYAGSRTTRNTVAATDLITAADILKIRRTLKRAKVKPITVPSGGKGYLAFAHTDVIYDLMQTTEWKDQNTYVDTKNREEGIAGKLYGVYFLETDNASKLDDAGAGGAVDVYLTLVIGKGFAAVADIEGGSKPEMIIHKAGSAGTGDPLNQFNTVGWKANLAAARLNELCAVRYESAASA